MTLEKDEQAFSLLHERVGARIVRSCENAIAARRQIIFGRLVPSGMRHMQTGRNAGCQGVIRYSCALEHAEAFIAEGAPHNTIDVESGRVRRQAGPDAGVSVLLGPLH